MTLPNHRTDIELIQLVRSNDDETAREALIVRYTGLARAIARRYSRRGLAYDDVLQSGYLGLIHAVDRYDPVRGVPLERYAARMIEGEIMHLFRDSGWAVRVPRSLQELSRRVAGASEHLSHELGRTPTVSELAERLEVDEGQVGEALVARRAYRADSLNLTAEDGEERSNTWLVESETGFGRFADRDQLAVAMQRLAPREREIVSLRFFGDMTQSEIATTIGISQMHVSRLLRSSLKTMGESARAAV